jgi:hypothetical protein
MLSEMSETITCVVSKIPTNWYDIKLSTEDFI